MMTLIKSKKIPCLQKCFIPLTPIEIAPTKKMYIKKATLLHLQTSVSMLNCKNDYWVCNYCLNDKYHSKKSGLH